MVILQYYICFLLLCSLGNVFVSHTFTSLDWSKRQTQKFIFIFFLTDKLCLEYVDWKWLKSISCRSSLSRLGRCCSQNIADRYIYIFFSDYLCVPSIGNSPLPLVMKYPVTKWSHMCNQASDWTKTTLLFSKKKKKKCCLCYEMRIH